MVKSREEFTKLPFQQIKKREEKAAVLTQIKANREKGFIEVHIKAPD